MGLLAVAGDTDKGSLFAAGYWVGLLAVTGAKAVRSFGIYGLQVGLIGARFGASVALTMVLHSTVSTGAEAAELDTVMLLPAAVARRRSPLLVLLDLRIQDWTCTAGSGSLCEDTPLPGTVKFMLTEGSQSAHPPGTVQGRFTPA